MSFGMKYGNHYTGPDGILYSNSINGERFVYYQRLATDVGENEKLWKKIYAKSSELMRYRIQEGADTAKIAQYFEDLRDGEFAKESKLLSEKFGNKILGKYDYKKASGPEEADEISAQLIEALNEALNLKEVFKRNLAVLTQTNQKQLITWFPTYFDNQLTKKSTDILDAIWKEASENKKNLEQAVETVINQMMPELVKDTLIYMFKEAGVEEIGMDPELQAAYKELIPYLESSSSIGNEFIQSMIKSYNLDDLTKIFNPKKRLTRKNIASQLNKFKLYNKATIHSQGGLASEDLSVFIADVMGQGISGFKANLIGDTKQKADAIFTIDLPLNEISDWLENNSFGTRGKDTEAISKLQEKLGTFDDGFIVYSNAKNYSLTNGEGFSAGEAINMETWDDMMHSFNKKGRDLIFMAINTIPGAIGENEVENVRTAFARAIASALFDDFNVIGEVPKNGVQSIHLLYLNGIYVPLSFYFHLLSQAFREYSKENIRNIISVELKTPSNILWPTMEEQIAYRESHPELRIGGDGFRGGFSEGGETMWNIQSHDALRNTKISYHFFQKYRDIMKRLNFNLE